jgi:hypothetical protein
MHYEKKLFVLPRKPAAALPPEVQELIGRRLREYYGQQLREPLPARFVDLLKELAKPE